MRETYAAFSSRMIQKYEGGYGWNRKDPGGPTKYGITCFDLAEHMGQKMDSMDRWAPIVRAMPLEAAEAIYHKKYAMVVRYDELPAGVDVQMFDYGVNSGTSRPIRVVRTILNVPGGNRVDDALLNAIKKTDSAKLIEAISAERLRFMHAIRGGSAWAEFGGGWGARVADLKSYALRLVAANGAAVDHAPAPDLSKIETPKATHGSPTTVKTAVKTAGVGSASTGAAAHEAGLPPWVVAVAMGFVVAAGVLYVIYSRQRALVLNDRVDAPIKLPFNPAAVAA